MEKIGLKELNQQTSRVLDRVRDGERLVITDHGRSIAMLVPVDDTSSPLERMIASGQTRPPRSENLPAIRRVKLQETTAEILSEVRGDRL